MLKNAFSKRFKFKNWPKTNFPALAAGIYVIWGNQTLLYVNTAGKDLDKAQRSGKTKFGLITRLNSHASGRAAGDQFCSLLANRIIIPSLTNKQLNKLTDFSTTIQLKLLPIILSYILIIKIWDLMNLLKQKSLFKVKIKS